jgi:NADH-quinone oxidoreductase subunit G
MLRVGADHREASWPDALDTAAEGLQRALDTGGSGSIGVIGGARGTNEDAFLWNRFAKDVLGTDNVDAQLADGLPADVVLGLPRAVISDLDRARGIVLLGPDLQEELPVLHLRVRRAAVELGVPVVEIAPRASGLTREAAAVLRHAPGESGGIAQSLARALSGDGTASGDGQIERAVAALDGREGDLVVVLGRQSLAESPDAVVAAAAALAALPDLKFLSALRRSNVHGALDMGLAPGFAPGRVRRDGERGLDAAGILAAIVDGRIDTLVLLGVDLLTDFPDRALVRRAMNAVRFVVAVGAFMSEGAERADVFLPTSVWGEKHGTTTNLEGRVVRVARLVTPEGTAMEDWRVASELARRFGTDFELDTVEAVQDEIARVAPAYAGVDAALLSRARDGAVVPVAEHPDEIVFHPAPGVSAGMSWEPIPPAAAVASEPGADDAAPVTAAPVPDLYQWDRAAQPPVATPPDAYSLRLVAARTLYDAGRTVSSTPALAPLANGPAIVVHPNDLSRVGVAAAGDTVRVTSALGSVDVPVLIDTGVAPGTCFMPFAQDGKAGPSDLVDVTASVTELRVETVR